MSLFPITLDHMKELRRMTLSTAKEFLDYHYPDLLPSDRGAVLNLAIPDKAPESPSTLPVEPAAVFIPYRMTVDPMRNVFIVAAAQAGASQFQLATMFKVRRQTIYAILRHERGDELRAKGKRLHSITYERLGQMFDYFQQNLSAMRSLSPSEITSLLIIHSADE